MNEQATTPVPSEPLLGIFWSVPRSLGRREFVVATTPLSEGEPYGDFLTHPRGHHETWEGWRELGEAGLRRLDLPLLILTDEYEHYPRGRIVFSRPDAAFWIYANRRLHRPALVAEVRRRFGLSASRCVLKSDPHYRVTAA